MSVNCLPGSHAIAEQPEPRPRLPDCRLGVATRELPFAKQKPGTQDSSAPKDPRHNVSNETRRESELDKPGSSPNDTDRHSLATLDKEEHLAQTVNCLQEGCAIVAFDCLFDRPIQVDRFLAVFFVDAIEHAPRPFDQLTALALGRTPFLGGRRSFCRHGSRIEHSFDLFIDLIGSAVLGQIVVPVE